MFARVERPIPPDATSEDVERDLAEVGARLLVEVVDAIADGTAHEEPQDDAAGDLRAEDHARGGAHRLARPRGAHPRPGARALALAPRVDVPRRHPADRAGRPPWRPVGPGPAPGTVTEAAGDRWEVACGEGVVRLVEVQPEGRRAMRRASSWPAIPCRRARCSDDRARTARRPRRAAGRGCRAPRPAGRHRARPHGRSPTSATVPCSSSSRPASSAGAADRSPDRRVVEPPARTSSTPSCWTASGSASTSCSTSSASRPPPWWTMR
jgi:hypothetical protein